MPYDYYGNWVDDLSGMGGGYNPDDPGDDGSDIYAGMGYNAGGGGQNPPYNPYAGMGGAFNGFGSNPGYGGNPGSGTTYYNSNGQPTDQYGNPVMPPSSYYGGNGSGVTPYYGNQNGMGGAFNGLLPPGTGTTYYNNDTGQPVGNGYGTYYGNPNGMGGAFNGLIPPGEGTGNYYGYTMPGSPGVGNPPGSSGLGGAGGSGTTINNTYNAPPPPGGGSDPTGFNWTDYFTNQLMGQKYASDNTLAGTRYSADMSHQNAELTYQSAMAQIANQGQYYQGLLQQGQLDDASKRYIADRQVELGYAQAQATSDYQHQLADLQSQRLYGLEIPQMQNQNDVARQNADTTRMGTMGNLDLQRELGMGGLGISQQGADTTRMGVLGNLGLGQGQLGLQTGLGYGNLGISQQQADTSRYAQEVAAYLGQGNLNLGQGQLQAAIENARNQTLTQRAQIAASLQGPRNAFQQQAFLHGLNQNGVSNAVDMIAGRQILPQWGAPQAPLDPANLNTFQQDTGLTVPGGA